MGQETKIQWCDHTFNPWMGCTKVSAGCANCYAEDQMDRRWNKVKWGPQGTRIRTSAANWRQPLAWDTVAKARGVVAKVFCASLADVGEDRPEVVPWRAELCDLIRQCDSLRFLLLTKRPENMANLFPEDVLLKCWVGTSVEDQAAADKRIPHLLRCPAAVRFLSCEPLLGEVDIERADGFIMDGFSHDAIPGGFQSFLRSNGIDWVIIGGESGPNARPCNVERIRSLVAQCKAAGVPVFVKQLGSKPVFAPWHVNAAPTVGKWYEPTIGDDFDTRRILDRKGGDMNEWPEDLRVREFPNI